MLDRRIAGGLPVHDSNRHARLGTDDHLARWHAGDLKDAFGVRAAGLTGGHPRLAADHFGDDDHVLHRLSVRIEDAAANRRFLGRSGELPEEQGGGAGQRGIHKVRDGNDITRPQTFMAETYARCIAVLLCLLALPSLAAGQDAADRRSSNFLETIADGVKSVVSKESVPLLSSAAALALFALPFDETLTYSASCSTFLKTTFEGWARIGGQEWVLAGGSLATFVIGRATDHPKVAALGGDLVQAQVVAGVTTFALKHAIQRARPDGEPRSFPSGHAAGTFAAATVVQRHYGLKGAIPAYTAAVLDLRRAPAGQLALCHRHHHGRGGRDSLRPRRDVRARPAPRCRCRPR